MNYDEHCLIVLRVFIKIYCMLQSLLINLQVEKMKFQIFVSRQEYTQTSQFGLSQLTHL